MSYTVSQTRIQGHRGVQTPPPQPRNVSIVKNVAQYNMFIL